MADENKVVDIWTVKAGLERAMKSRGIKAKPLAIAAGMNDTVVRDILKGKSRDPKIGTLVKLAEVLETPVTDILGIPRVPLVGRIGAGGTIAWIDEPDPDASVPLPPTETANGLIALEVCGDSMLPRYDPGQIVYVRRLHDGLMPEYLGQYCAVELMDGGVFLKILSPGTEPGRYTLRSLNAADMENVEVRWASPVLFVMTPPTIKKR